MFLATLFITGKIQKQPKGPSIDEWIQRTNSCLREQRREEGWAKQVKRDKKAAAAKSLQSCLTLCNPIDSSPPGPHPWDSPGKSIGVGCHFLLQ